MSQAVTFEQAMEIARRLQFEGKIADAETVLRQLATAAPNRPDVLNELAMVLGTQDKFHESESLLRQVLTLSPGYIPALHNLSVIAERRGEYAVAIEHLRHATRIAPLDAASHHRLGTAMKHAGLLDEGYASVRYALSLAPDDQEIIGSFATYALMMGDFAAGLPAYEVRWKCDSFPDLRRNWTPISDLSELHDKRVVVYSEQGFGDAIQFSRYLPLLARQHPAELTVVVPSELRTLISWLPGVTRTVSTRTQISADILIPMMSLPHIFQTRLDAIPHDVPYVIPPASLVEKWRQRLEPYQQTLKVGIAWAGRPQHKQDRDRSLSLAEFLPLASPPNITFFSLQKGPAAAEANPPPAGLSVVNLTAGLADFADTAGFIANLDLVISVDTAIVHLAGAMAKPVWTLLPSGPDWRWLVGRDDSPWYPTMRLFRQTRQGDWPEVFTRIRSSLESLIP